MQGVVAAPAVERVVARRAPQGFIARLAPADLGQDGGDVPGAAVVKAQLLHRVVGAGRVVVPEEVVDGQPVFGADDRQLQRLVVAPLVAGDAPHADVAGQHAGLELHRVEFAGGAVVGIADGVLAVATPEQVAVVAIAAVQPVVAGAAVQGVVAVAAVECVVAVTAIEPVVAVTAFEVVVAAAAGHHIGAAGAEKCVVGITARIQQLDERGQVPDRAVTEFHLLDRVAGVVRVVVVGEELGGDAVVAADNGQFQRATGAALAVVDATHADVAGQHVGTELDGVELVDGGVEVAGDLVLAVATAEQEGVVAGAAVQAVIAFAAHEQVLACAAGEGVVAAAADEGVVTLVARQRVIVGAAIDQVVAACAEDGVNARAPVEGLVGIGAAEGIVAIGAGVDLGQNGVDAPDAAVVETDLLDTVVAIAGVVVVEETVDADLVGGAGDAEFQRAEGTEKVAVVGLPECHVARQHAGLELQRVGAGLAAVVVVVEPVLAVAPTEQEGLVAGAAAEPVVAAAAIQDVGAGAAVELVIARPAV